MGSKQTGCYCCHSTTCHFRQKIGAKTILDSVDSGLDKLGMLSKVADGILEYQTSKETDLLSDKVANVCFTQDKPGVKLSTLSLNLPPAKDNPFQLDSTTLKEKLKSKIAETRLQYLSSVPLFKSQMTNSFQFQRHIDSADSKNH